MPYRTVLARSLKLMFKHKGFLLMVLLQIAASSIYAVFTVASTVSSLRTELIEQIAGVNESIIAGLGIMLVFYLVTGVINLIVTSGVTKAALLADQMDDTTPPLTFTDVLRAGMPYWGRFLVLTILFFLLSLFLSFILILIVAFIAALLSAFQTLAIIVAALLMFFVIIILALFSLLQVIIQITVVTEDLPLGAAIHQALSFYGKNLSKIAVMGLILLGINLTVILLFFLPNYLFQTNYDTASITTSLSAELAYTIPVILMSIVNSAAVGLGAIFTTICWVVFTHHLTANKKIVPNPLDPIASDVNSEKQREN